MAYLGASILFILALSGLSNQETARRGNYFGMSGMAIALLATILGIVTANYILMFACIAIGGVIGLVLAKKSGNDPDAGTGGNPPQPGWPCSSGSGLRYLPGSQRGFQRC
jgi:hypothetical protein